LTVSGRPTSGFFPVVSLSEERTNRDASSDESLLRNWPIEQDNQHPEKIVVLATEKARRDEKRNSNYSGVGRLDVPPLVEAFHNICDRWGLSGAEQQIILGLNGMPVLAERILSGEISLSLPDVNDRISLVVGISLLLGQIYDDDVLAARRWLANPLPQLNGDSPLDHILRGRMSQLYAVRDVIRDFRSL